MNIRFICGLCVTASLLTGCGMFGSTPPPPPPPVGPVTAFMIDNEPGATVELDDPEFGNDIRVTIQDAFTSASGEQCKRATLLARERESEIVVICRSPEGQWGMAPRIWGQGINQ